MSNTCYLDSYALIEIACGNALFEPFAQRHVLTGVINLAEASFVLRKRLKRADGDALLQHFWNRVVHLDPSDAKHAADLRMRFITVSYIDGLGYSVARRLGIPFVTGDRLFKGMPGVEFVR